jgi:hypothetical protein
MESCTHLKQIVWPEAVHDVNSSKADSEKQHAHSIMLSASSASAVFNAAAI